MAKIYLPSEYVNHDCKVINNGYIRVYENNNYNSWVDIYVDQDYMIKPGSSNYGQNPVCDTLNEYTDSYMYRTDIFDIWLLFLALIGFVYFIISKLVKTLFRGFKLY